MSNIEVIWGPLRSLLRERCTSYRLVQILSRTTLDITELTQLTMGSSTEEKNVLIGAVDNLYHDMDTTDRRRFLILTTEELLSEKPELRGLLEKYLARVGWKIHEDTIVPIEIYDVDELTHLPKGAHSDLLRAAARLRDGDLSGAVSAACGAVDSVTTEVYAEKGLGEPNNHSFQQRVARSLEALDLIEVLKSELEEIGWDEDDADRLAKNVKGALNQGAFVLQKLRSDMGDVHGTRPTLAAVVFDTLKWAALTVRLLRAR